MEGKEGNGKEVKGKSNGRRRERQGMQWKGREKRKGESGWDGFRRQEKGSKSQDRKGEWGGREGEGKGNSSIKCIFATGGTWPIWHSSSLSLSWRGFGRWCGPSRDKEMRGGGRLQGNVEERIVLRTERRGRRKNVIVGVRRMGKKKRRRKGEGGRHFHP